MKIKINTNINSPCCPCEIVADDGRSLLVQTDWDYPGIASSFGWSVIDAQIDARSVCRHEHTDGTVACPDCGLLPGSFIESAGDFLRDNHGLEAEDPGYFDN